MAKMDKDLGKTIITPKANNLGSYERLDIIAVNGSSYLSLKDDNTDAATNQDSWLCIAHKGDTGASAYKYYFDNTVDNPKLTEVEFKALLAVMPINELTRISQENDREVAAQELAAELACHLPIILNGYWSYWDVASSSYKPSGKQAIGNTGASIISATFNNDDIEFHKDNGNNVVLANAKNTLTGPQGEKGSTGKNLSVLGYYPTLVALGAAIPAPNIGDAYAVGSGPYNLYVFDGVTLSWIDNGELADVSLLIDQTTGQSLLKSMSQKTITDELNLKLAKTFIPTALSVDYQEKITLGNLTPRAIAATLTPDSAPKNILFLGDNNAISVSPNGFVEVKKLGTSVVHIIPIANTLLYKTIVVEVTAPTISFVGAAIRLSGTNIRLT